MNPITLACPRSHAAQPQFVAVTLLPDQGMRVSQIRAFVPAQGEIDLLASPPRPQRSADADGSARPAVAGAFLVPFANRIRGKLLPDGKTIAADVAGRVVHLPANWSGKRPGAERHAIHGLILNTPMNSVQCDEAGSAFGQLHAGDFGGHWIGNTDLEIRASLEAGAVEFEVTAKNVGQEATPMGMGWHPYWAVPSGRREQVRLRLPARRRALVNNYDDSFPTGEVAAVAATAHDFTAPGGKPLEQLFLDDCFLDLQAEQDGSIVCEVADPAAGLGLRIIGRSPEIRAIQVYAPQVYASQVHAPQVYAPDDKQFVALEPQFNLADPFNRAVWGGRDTGMVPLPPGQSVGYRVRLEIFAPAPRVEA